METRGTKNKRKAKKYGDVLEDIKFMGIKNERRGCLTEELNSIVLKEDCNNWKKKSKFYFNR